jgi:hypothetical protein
MNETIKSTIERTRQYWYIDGFNEMLTGLVFVLLAGINSISGPLEPSVYSAILVGVGYPAVILLATTVGARLVNNLKTRLTYPRTGYVQYIRPEPGERRKRAITSGVVSMVVAIAAITLLSGQNPRIYVITMGSLIALFMIMFALRIPLPRFYLAGLWTILVTIAAYYLDISLSNRMVLLLAGSGLGLVVSGAGALYHYMNHTHPAGPRTGVD